MNKELLQRIKTAGGYQKKAVRALFPEQMNGHLDVIEQEVKMMVMEIAAGMAKKCRKADACEDEDGQAQEKASGVKKVTIS